MDLDELKQLVIDVPRYTSYPTAAEFSPALGAEAHAANLRGLAATTKAPLSMYVHLPFCKALCHFCGCHALVARTDNRHERYLGALHTEVELVAHALGDTNVVGELHFGGGSPSLVPAREFARLMEALRTRFAFTPDAEIALEADPRTTDREKLECYRGHGVARISFGFQDLDDGVQHAIGRHQSADVSRAAYDLARDVGFQGINVDLCYGLPEQTEATFARTIDQTIALGPDRIALFGYAHVPWLKPQQKRIDVTTLPGVDLRLRLMAEAHARLRAARYEAIGFDHFALPTDSLALAARERRLHRNFQGYTTTRTEALVGLGLSAISDLPAAYAQNARTLREYYGAIDQGRLPTERGAARSPDDHLRGDIIRRLMCSFRLDGGEVGRDHGFDFATAFAPELAAMAPLVDQGLVTVNGDLIEVTELGRLFVRNVAVVFDAYRAAARARTAAAPERRFSSSV